MVTAVKVHGETKWVPRRPNDSAMKSCLESRPMVEREECSSAHERRGRVQNGEPGEKPSNLGNRSKPRENRQSCGVYGFTKQNYE